MARRLNVIIPSIFLGGLLLGASSCSSNTSDASRVVVFAAASLADAMTEIAEAFVLEYPGSKIDFNFGSSSDLATQIAEGAPADVFASADTVNIDSVRTSGVNVGEEFVFATNVLEILVEAGNPLGIGSLADLSNPGLIFVTCDENVPIGRYSAEVLARANVSVIPKSYEENVKGIVNKVVLGEADAGIVYRTDVIAAGSTATGIAIPKEQNFIARLPIATIGDTPTPMDLAFVDFVTSSPIAQGILSTYGFGRP